MQLTIPLLACQAKLKHATSQRPLSTALLVVASDARFLSLAEDRQECHCSLNPYILARELWD